jgi:hypothetical protein
VQLAGRGVYREELPEHAGTTGISTFAIALAVAMTMIGAANGWCPSLVLFGHGSSHPDATPLNRDTA